MDGFAFDKMSKQFKRTDPGLESGQTSYEMDRIERIEDQRAKREAARIKRYINSKVDDITKYLTEYLDVPSLCGYSKYTNMSFPRDERGWKMNVEKYYPTLNLCVDKIPAKWLMERILAKKWLIEQLGYKYIWLKEDESIRNEEEFWSRSEPLKDKPAYEIKPPFKLV